MPYQFAAGKCDRQSRLPAVWKARRSDSRQKKAALLLRCVSDGILAKSGQAGGRDSPLRRMRKGAAGARPNPQILPSCLLYCASLWYCAERSERSSMSVTPNKSTSKTAGVQKDQPMLTHDQFQRELSYRAAISVARRLLENKLITQKEFVRIDAVLRRKFSPVWGGLYPDNG